LVQAFLKKWWVESDFNNSNKRLSDNFGKKITNVALEHIKIYKKVPAVENVLTTV
jgi:hypothetical protein